MSLWRLPHLSLLLFALVAVVLAVPAGAAAPAIRSAGMSIVTSSAQAVAGSIEAGASHACAVAMNGTVTCWGNDADGQATPPGGSFVALSAGTNHAGAIRPNSTIACWGDNTSGQATPPTGTFGALRAGSAHTCGLKTDESVVCWGDNTYGQSSPPARRFIAIA